MLCGSGWVQMLCLYCMLPLSPASAGCCTSLGLGTGCNCSASATHSHRHILHLQVNATLDEHVDVWRKQKLFCSVACTCELFRDSAAKCLGMQTGAEALFTFIFGSMRLNMGAFFSISGMMTNLQQAASCHSVTAADNQLHHNCTNPDFDATSLSNANSYCKLVFCNLFIT